MPEYCGAMLKNQYVVLFALALTMAAITFGLQSFWPLQVPPYTYFSLLYLYVLMAFLHYLVFGKQTNNANAVVRRMMVASMLRLLLTAAFLLITLMAFKPVSVIFISFYCAYFALFLLFEISQKRYKLRPDFKPRSE
jgi:hypothetical protein